VDRTDTEVSTRVSTRPPSGWLVAAALFLTGAGIACGVWMYHPAYINPNWRPWDMADLLVYRAAGKAITHGHSVYGSYVGNQLDIRLPFIYPPIAAVLAIPFTWLSPETAGQAWTLLTLLLLAGVVRVVFAPLIERYDKGRGLAWLLAFGAMAALAPVEDHIRFGQVGIPLMACAVFDCAVKKPKWPRGMLIGIATAFKLVPAIFIPYLLFTRRVRAAAVATGTFVVLSLLGAAIAPSDSWKFWTDKMFQPTSPTFFSNQSLEGILQRALGPWRLFWLIAVAAVMVFGLWRASVASLAGDELRGIAIVGLAGVLVSPISWIHHLVWIVPVIAVLVGRGDNRRRLLAAFLVSCAFVARLPYVGHDELHGNGFWAAALQDSYGLLCLGLLIYLSDIVPVAGAWFAKWSATRSRATSVAAPR